MAFLYRISAIFLFFFIPVSSFAQLNSLGDIQKTVSSVDKLVSEASDFVGKIDAAVDEVKNKKLYKALLDGKEFKFPVGILPESGDANYALVVNKVFVTPEGMFAEIFMKVPGAVNVNLRRCATGNLPVLLRL